MAEALIRPAKPEDAADIARLILLSAEQFLPAVFGPQIRSGLERLAARGSTLFSFAYAVIADVDGRCAGMLLGYSGKEKAREDPATGLGLLRVLGFDMAKRLGRLLRVQRLIGSIAAGEWYVSNVAVVPEMRGRGIGRALLAEAERRARRAYCARIVLDVETDHDPAISLYTSLAYARTSTTPSFILDGRAFAFFRMSKALL
jgi:ribosomal protein S18 acetylase RimI-like enzyme